MLNLAEYQKRPAALADYLPWACLIAPGVILNKDGSFQRTFAYRGPDLESSTFEELVGVCARVNNVLRRFSSGWALFFEAQRLPALGYPTSEWRDALAWLVDEERRAAFEEADTHFESAYYLTFVYLPPAETIDRAENLLLERPDGREGRAYREHLERFIAETTRALDLLGSIMPSARALDDDETLTFLHSTISPKRHRVVAPEIPAYLDGVLVDADLSGGLEPTLGSEVLKTISILGLSSRTARPSSSKICPALTLKDLRA